MKKVTIFALILVLACSMAACGCQKNNNMGDNTTNTTKATTAPTTQPMIDPTILDPTFETNIPDSTVNGNSTDKNNMTDPTHGTNGMAG